MTYCKVFRGIRFHFAYALPKKPIISLQSVTFYKSVFEHTRFCGLQKNPRNLLWLRGMIFR